MYSQREEEHRLEMWLFTATIKNLKIVGGRMEVAMKRIISLFLCLAVMSVCILNEYVAFANTTGTEISVSIKENNGISVPNNLYRRGFPLPKGEVFSLDNFGLYDTLGNAVPSVFEITEKYSDGSIKWALCSFVTDLKQDELKEFKICNKGAAKIENPVSVSKTSDGYCVKNSDITVEINSKGIKTISCGSSSFTDNITGYLTLNGKREQEMTITKINILKQNDLYVKIKAEGVFGTDATGELTFTVASGVNKVELEHRLSAVRDLNIYSMGYKIVPKSSSTFYYPTTQYTSNNVVGSDYIYSSNSNNKLVLLTRDTERFRAATTDASSTGFVFNTDNIYFAPIVNGKRFTWYDGLNRTTQITASFEDNAEQQIETMKNAPTIVIDPNQFAAAGVIEMAGSCTPIDSVINLVHYDSDKRDGRLDAGAIHYTIDPDTETLGESGTHPGEMEYNLGVAYMATGDKVVYDTMYESAKCWADVEIYRGQFEEIYGANRYRTAGADYGNDRFKMTHPYYGDTSGLYMAYILSGDEDLGDTFKLAVNHIYNNMYVYSKPNCGYRMPHMFEWYQSDEPVVRDYIEVRFLIQARPMYLAYGLFGDEKYREASLEMARWGAATQSDDGWWYQVRYDNGDLFEVMPGEYAVKNYLIMYGLRGISFLSRYEDTPEIRQCVLRTSDFVKSEYDRFGKGMWKPTGDETLFKCDEDKTRSKGPYEDIMAMEILYRAYKMSGDDKYFKTLLDCVETWFSSMNPSGAAVLFANQEGYGNIQYMGGGQNYTTLMLFPELRKLFSENADKIKALGYDYILTAFGENAHIYKKTVERDSKYLSEVTQIVFENGDDKVLYATNHFGGYSGDYTKEYYTGIPEGGLWTGIENQVTYPGGVTLYKKMKQYDRILAIHTPIYITSMSDAVTAYVDEYSEKKIVFRVYGSGEMNFSVKDGKFKIKDGERYSVTVARDGDNGAKITVCSSCVKNRMAADKGLNFKIMLNKKLSLTDTEAVSAYSAASLGLMTTNESAFNPTAAADVKEFENAAAELTGIEKPYTGSTYTDAASYALEIIDEVNPQYLSSEGIIKKNMTVIGKNISDGDAVKYGTKFLTVPECVYVGTDMPLPQKSVGSCSVEWKCDNEDKSITLNDGVLSVKDTDLNELALTAYVKRGNEVSEKRFNVMIKRASDVDWYANSQSNMDNKHMLNNMTGEFEIKFTLVPNAAKTNALVGFSSTAVAANIMRDIPVIFRLNPNGAFDAINKDAYCANENIPYEIGKSYDVRMKISMPKKQYSVFVTPENGSEITLGKDYAFRESALLSNNIDVVYTPTATSGTRLFNISYMSCAAIPDDYDTTGTIYDENGLMFGKYADGNLYLPEYIESEKISWVSSKKEAVTNRGVVTLKAGIEDVIVFGMVNESDKEISAVDILNELCLIEYTDGADDVLSRQQAAEILSALRYVVNSKQSGNLYES